MNYFAELDKIEKLPVLPHSLKRDFIINHFCEFASMDGKSAKQYLKEETRGNGSVKGLEFSFEIAPNVCKITIHWAMMGVYEFITHGEKTTEQAVKKTVKEFYKRYNKSK
jgi:hypothetical protein